MVIDKAKKRTADQDGRGCESYSKFRVRWRHVLLIDQRIKSGKPVNCSILAKELEVSRRTVLRDLDFLRDDLGAPVEYDAAKGSYRYTEPNWDLPNLKLSEGELFSLMVAEKALEAYAGTPWARKLQRIFERITACLPERVEIAPHALLPRISFGREACWTVVPEVLETVSRAVRENQTLRMTYFALDRGKVREYVIDPYLLRQARGAWYLAARDKATGYIPLFNLSRVKNIFPTGETFDYEESGFDPEKYFQGTFTVQESSDRYRVVIEFYGTAGQLVRERQWHSSQKLKELTGGKLRFEVEISSLYDILPWILSWGGGAKVIEPKELVDLARRQVSEMKNIYSVGD